MRTLMQANYVPLATDDTDDHIIEMPISNYLPPRENKTSLRPSEIDEKLNTILSEIKSTSSLLLLFRKSKPRLTSVVTLSAIATTIACFIKYKSNIDDYARDYNLFEICYSENITCMGGLSGCHYFDYYFDECKNVCRQLWNVACSEQSTANHYL